MRLLLRICYGVKRSIKILPQIEALSVMAKKSFIVSVPANVGIAFRRGRR